VFAGTIWLILFDRSSNAAPFHDVACLSRKSLDLANRRGQGHNNCHPHDHSGAGAVERNKKGRLQSPICSPGKNGNVEHTFPSQGSMRHLYAGNAARRTQQVPAEDLEPPRFGALTLIRNDTLREA
jgi:hypothetical protein